MKGGTYIPGAGIPAPSTLKLLSHTSLPAPTPTLLSLKAYVDPNFNNVDWIQELSERLNSTSAAGDPNEVQAQLKDMLARLGDPFTRWVAPR